MYQKEVSWWHGSPPTVLYTNTVLVNHHSKVSYLTSNVMRQKQAVRGTLKTFLEKHIVLYVIKS